MLRNCYANVTIPSFFGNKYPEGLWNMRGIKAFCAVAGFALVAMVLLPLIVYDFNASNQEYPTVTVVVGGEAAAFTTAAQTVGDFLRELDIVPSGYDRIAYPKHFAVYEGMVLHIVRQVPFTVALDGGTPESRTAPGGTTVGEILLAMQEANGIVYLYANDANRVIEPMDELHFLSWDSRDFTSTEEIPYETIHNYTDAIRYGRAYLTQQGTPGEREYTTTVFYLGGVEESRVVSHEIIHIAPLAMMYDVGIAPLGALADTNAPEFRYVRQIRMQATAYCACVRCTGKQPDDRRFGITASGRHVEHGIVAVDRTLIPLGTHLYVAGYGFAIAADVGGSIRGNRIDLYMYCHEEARQFGRRYLDVYVLN
jgi:3D (Asp-Asp-Asp) domain-containing protein